MANVLGVKTNVGIRLIIALIKGLEFGLNILEKYWKGFGKSLEKMCGNPGTRHCERVLKKHLILSAQYSFMVSLVDVCGETVRDLLSSQVVEGAQQEISKVTVTSEEEVGGTVLYSNLFGSPLRFFHDESKSSRGPIQRNIGNR